MPCYRPIPALTKNPGDQPQLWPPLGTANLWLPCGKCLGCRTARATHWARRCEHEATQWQHNTFLTLTYDDAHLPEEGHLNAHELQKFFKRLRQNLNRHRHRHLSDPRSTARYFACGEYGERNGRPHYHAILFNWRPAQGTRVGRQHGNDIHESDLLAELWPAGGHRYGMATPASANYIAQYSLKKIGTGDADQDGVYRPAPFLRMSRSPIIGSTWLDRYSTDLRHGYAVNGARRESIPRSYLEQLKKRNPQLTEEIQCAKQQHQLNNRSDGNTPARLEASEIIHTRYKQLTENRQL